MGEIYIYHDAHLVIYNLVYTCICLPVGRHLNNFEDHVVASAASGDKIYIFPDVFQVNMLTWSHFVKTVCSMLNISPQQIKMIKSYRSEMNVIMLANCHIWWWLPVISVSLFSAMRAPIYLLLCNLMMDWIQYRSCTS